MGSYLCNNFLMDHVYFLIHHIPCSYRCENTIELAKNVEERIMGEEPGFVKKSRDILKKPLLVFGEKNFVIFDGKLKGNGIIFKELEYMDNPARKEDSIGFIDMMKKGDEIRMDENGLDVLRNGEVLERVDRKPDWFMIDFD